jgi:hypothetical protein
MPCWNSTEHWPLIEAQQWDRREALLSDPAGISVCGRSAGDRGSVSTGAG